MTIREAIHAASASIARRDAETLALHVLGRLRPWLLAHPEAALSPEDADRFAALVARRARFEPLQYLTEQQEFFGLGLEVTPDVLIPRPETELLVESVLNWARERERARAREQYRPQGSRGGQPSGALRIVDVGTGSGAIALALAANLPEADITALDLSPAALAVAKANALRHHLQTRVDFRLSDLLLTSESELLRAADWNVVVSNPPYVPYADAPEMQPEVRDFEPHLALFADEGGLAFYRRLIPQAETALRAGGLLALEIGFGQRIALTALLDGWKHLRFYDDLAGIPRVVLAERPS